MDGKIDIRITRQVKKRINPGDEDYIEKIFELTPFFETLNELIRKIDDKKLNIQNLRGAPSKRVNIIAHIWSNFIKDKRKPNLVETINLFKWFNRKFYGDIGINGNTISELSNPKGKSATNVINAKGMVVTPGFIDMHTHCNEGLGEPGTNANLNHLTQGVTTVVVGNCEGGTFKIAKAKAKWEKKGIGTNAVLLVRFGTVQNEVLGAEDRISP